MESDISLWRVDQDAPRRIDAAGVPLESHLEDLIEQDPAVLGDRLLLLGRQVPTDLGGRIDLLGLGPDGTLHVIELKRDRAPRDVLAQVLEYGAWARLRSHEDVTSLYKAQHPGRDLETAFAAAFDAPLPDELNTDQRLTVVVHTAGTAIERTVEYLADFGVPVNVLLFSAFVDGDRSYVARTLLLDEDTTADVRPRAGRTREPWNKRDWYVAFGESSGSRDWDDASRFGFVSAGAKAWYTRTLKRLPPGARIFAHIPKTGYVGVGTVAGAPQPYDEAVLEVDGEQRRFTDLPLAGSYVHAGDQDDRSLAEYVVPVAWTKTLARDQAVWQKDMFANQNSACPLRHAFTLAVLREAFGLAE